MITPDTFRNRQWDLIDPLIAVQNARLPEGWYWECGGMCARLYSPSVYSDQTDPSHRAWAQCDGSWSTYPPEYASGLGVQTYAGDTSGFEEALSHVTDMALAFISREGDDISHTEPS